MTFIAFEGLDASGKTTQARRLAARLGERCVLTREPGDTALGARIRQLLLDPDGDMTAETEALLMAADRAQHAHEVIGPNVQSGRIVICDRYISSSVAYQGYGRELDVAMVRRISAWATHDLWPDLTVFLRIPARTAVQRLAATGERLDRLEAQGLELLSRVEAGYDQLLATEPTPWIGVDGTVSPDEVESSITEALRASGWAFT